MTKNFEAIKRAKIIADKLTDEEIDTIFANPGVSKFFRAFSDGAVVEAEINGRAYIARDWGFFKSPQVSDYPWRIIKIIESNGK